MNRVLHPVGSRPGISSRARQQAARLALGFGIFLFAFGIVALRSSLAPDIFTDEIIYTRAAIRVAAEGALVWDSGVPFLVHPPLYFLIAALYNGLTGSSQISVYSPGDIFATVYHTRLLNAVFAGLTALGLFAFARRLFASAEGERSAARLLWLGLTAAVLFALDPFGVRTNRRAMLETLAALLSLMGMLLYWRSIQRRSSTEESSAKAFSPRSLLAGLVLGASLLAKELAFIHLFGILLFAAWEFALALPGLLRKTDGLRRLLLPLRVPAAVNALAAVGLAGITYLIYPLWAFSTGRWDLFAEEKLLGFRRMLGLIQLTGWNREGISFFSLFLQRLEDYGTTYLLLALGGAAAVWLGLIGLRRSASGRPYRLLASWGIIIYPFFAFLMLFGSGNDQFFYYLLAPAVLLVTSAAYGSSVMAKRALPERQALNESQALERLANRRKASHRTNPERSASPGEIVELLYSRLERAVLTAARFAPVFLLLVMLPFNAVKWMDKFIFDQDNGYAQLSSFARQNLPPEAAINASGDPIKFAYFFPERPVYALAQPQQAEAARLEYFVLAPKDVALRYGRITPELADWIVANGEPLFAFEGDSYGEIFLFRVTPQTTSAASARPPQPVARHFQVAQAGFVDSLIAMLMLWFSAWVLMVVFVQRITRGRRETESEITVPPMSAV